MINFLAVFVGGGVGALLRHLVNLFFASKTGLPLLSATLSVNFFGTLILGFCFNLFLQKNHMPQSIQLALTVGFCGGITTFSTFSMELLNMITHTQYIQAFLYLFLSVLLCVSAAFIGMWLATVVS